MQITRFTDYALRILIDLALTPEDTRTIDELSRRHAISRHHVMKVVQSLNKAGYVRTVRGKNGGVCLGRAAEAINIGQVVRTTENLALVQCMGPNNRCSMTPACRLKGLLSDALQAFLNELDHRSLADLASPREALLSTLEHPSSHAYVAIDT